MIVSLLFQYCIFSHQVYSLSSCYLSLRQIIKSKRCHVVFTYFILFLHMLSSNVFSMNRDGSESSSSLEDIPLCVRFYGNPDLFGSRRSRPTDTVDATQYGPLEDCSICYQSTFCGFFGGMGLGSIFGSSVGFIGGGYVGACAGCALGAAAGSSLGSSLGAAYGCMMIAPTDGDSNSARAENDNIATVVTQQPVSLLQEVYDQSRMNGRSVTSSTSSLIEVSPLESTCSSSSLSISSSSDASSNSSFEKYLRFCFLSSSSSSSSSEEEVAEEDVWVPRETCLLSESECRGKGESHNSQESDKDTSGNRQDSSGNSQSGQQKTKGSSASGSGDVLLVTEKETCLFIPGYSHEGQVSSLLGLQGVLQGSTEKVITTLRLLALQHTNKHTVGQSLEIDSRPRSQIPSSDIISSYVQLQNPCSLRYFSIAADNYESNLECKSRLAQLGLTMNPTPYIHVGLMYHRQNKYFSFSKEVQLDSACGIAKAKTKVEGLAGIVTLNPDKAGLTGQFASYYGWGNTKNHRSIGYIGRELETKGRSKIHLSGGLVQLGYNLPLANNWFLIPYIENVFSIVTWNGYKETPSPFACSISKNKEQLWRNSIGMKTIGKIGNNSQMQIWTAYSTGYHKIAGLTSMFLDAPMKKYQVAVPGIDRKSTQVEVGISHQTKITTTLTSHLNAITKINNEKLDTSHLTLSIAYHY